jgi:hypothetical protein
VSGGIAPSFLTCALDGGEWSVSRSGRFHPGETSTDTHWVGLRTGLDTVKNRKNLLALPGIEPRFLVRSSRSLITMLSECVPTACQ